MAQENRLASAVSLGASRWHAGAVGIDAKMQPTAGAQCIDLRGSFRSAQSLAGSGALVFEGELLEGPRFQVH